MYASVRAFLHEIIDYAGLFPPAQLPLETALAEYLHHKKHSPQRWMLGRFVCPAARLAELLPLAKSSADAELLQVTALGQRCSAAGDFLPQVAADLQAIQNFRRAWGNDAVLDTCEVALPLELAQQSLADVVTRMEAYCQNAELRWFIEIPWTQSWTFYAELLADISRIRHVGVKLRTGGLTADAFPSDDQVALFIACCRAAHLPWKATAGLHHPCRHWDPALQIWHHGFLNVFGAGLLAQAHSLTGAEIVPILADREGTNFHFDEKRLAWKEWSCSAAQIAEFRASGPRSFGCCSFAEPCADLTALGLLAEPEA